MARISTIFECPDATERVLDCRHLLSAASIRIKSRAELALSEMTTLTCSGVLADGSVSRLQLRQVEPLDDRARNSDLRFEIPLHYLNSLNDKSKLQMTLLAEDLQVISSEILSVLTLTQSCGMLAPIAMLPLYFDGHTPTSFRVTSMYNDAHIKFEVGYGRDDQWPTRIDTFESVNKTNTITGLQPLTKYFVNVRVLTSQGWVDFPEGVTHTQQGLELPDAPTDLSAGSASYSVALTWKESALATGYRVSYGLHPNGSVIDTATFLTPGGTMSGLNSNTSYYFDLLAYNTAGNSPSVRATAITLQVPAPPASVHATPAILTMDLTWSPSTGANRYIVRHGVESGGAAQTETVYSTSYQLTGLSKNTLYFVEVAAANANGSSLPTRITQKTLDGPPIPSRPGPMHKVVTFDKVEVNWVGSSAPNFEFVYGLDDKYPEVIGRHTTKYFHHSIIYLAPDTKYFLELRAFNESGYSEPSSTSVITGPDMTQPRGVHNPGRTFSESWLKWESPVDQSYLIDYEITCPGREPVRTTALEHILTDLIPEKAYTFNIQPRRIAGPVPAMPVSIQVVTHDRVPPTKPGNLKLTASARGDATLDWRASEDNVGVTGYQMRRNGEAWVAVSGTSCPVTGLIDGVVERFEVRARDAAGNWSIPACVSSRNAPPNPPQNFRYSQLGALSIMEWDAPIATMEVTGYEVVLTGPQGGELRYSVVNRVLMQVLRPQTRYDVRIFAKNAGGNSLPLIAQMTTK
ncbi:fibronectin type III domain-containing protein [Pseudomonas violetae]|uniref:Fibronectin type-III domain-containing protein n=1 Tax=Pseudomonas violetae TaxID=2915813 RepID=A0ABT0EXF3_9PSED|nr:hypothetical protein [Pseudomonas violetae]MCK1790433.1 hypothetical protein [Pseudomonas violetae]